MHNMVPVVAMHFLVGGNLSGSNVLTKTTVHFTNFYPWPAPLYEKKSRSVSKKS